MIHIFAGLKVCIQAITPTTESSALASIAMRRIASVDLSTGIHLTVTGTCSPSWSAIALDCSATCLRVSSP